MGKTWKKSELVLGKKVSLRNYAMITKGNSGSPSL